jgi:hypothetical protein
MPIVAWQQLATVITYDLLVSKCITSIAAVTWMFTMQVSARVCVQHSSGCDLMCIAVQHTAVTMCALSAMLWMSRTSAPTYAGVCFDLSSVLIYTLHL